MGTIDHKNRSKKLMQTKCIRSKWYNKLALPFWITLYLGDNSNRFVPLVHLQRTLRGLNDSLGGCGWELDSLICISEPRWKETEMSGFLTNKDMIGVRNNWNERDK